MPTSQPKTKGNELVAKLSAFTLENVPNDFTKRQLLRDADAVKKINPSEGWMLTGVILSRAFNYKDAKHAFETAIHLNTAVFEIVIVNYCESLMFLNKDEEALGIAEKYLQPDNFDLITTALRLASNLGLYEKVFEFYDMLKSFNDSRIAHPLPFLYDHFKKIASASKVFDISGNDISAVYSLVMSSVHSAKKMVIRYGVYIMDDDFMTIEFYVDADTDVIHKISMDVIDKLCDANDAIPALKKRVLLPAIYGQRFEYGS